MTQSVVRATMNKTEEDLGQQVALLSQMADAFNSSFEQCVSTLANLFAAGFPATSR